MSRVVVPSGFSHDFVTSHLVQSGATCTGSPHLCSGFTGVVFSIAVSDSVSSSTVNGRQRENSSDFLREPSSAFLQPPDLSMIPYPVHIHAQEGSKLFDKSSTWASPPPDHRAVSVPAWPQMNGNMKALLCLYNPSALSWKIPRGKKNT